MQASGSEKGSARDEFEFVDVCGSMNFAAQFGVA